MQMTAAPRVIHSPQSWQLFLQFLQYGLKNSLVFSFLPSFYTLLELFKTSIDGKVPFLTNSKKAPPPVEI